MIAPSRSPATIGARSAPLRPHSRSAATFGVRPSIPGPAWLGPEAVLPNASTGFELRASDLGPDVTRERNRGSSKRSMTPPRNVSTTVQQVMQMRLERETYLERTSLRAMEQPRMSIFDSMSATVAAIKGVHGHSNTFLALACAWFLCSSTFFAFLTKLNGDRAPETKLELFLTIALAQLLAVGMYVVINMRLYWSDLRWLLSALFSWQYWLACFPYAVGYSLTYYLLFKGMGFISAAGSFCVMQSRLGIDLVLAYLMMGTKVSTSTVLQLALVGFTVITYINMLDSGETSKDPMLGLTLMLCYSFVSGITYAYMPWAIARFNLQSTVCVLLTSLQMTIICGVIGGIRSDWDFSGFDLKMDGMLMVTWMNVDAAYFFCPIWLTPLALTLMCTLGIPILYFVELWYYSLEAVSAHVFAVLCITLAVFAYVLQPQAGDRASPIN